MRTDRRRRRTQAEILDVLDKRNRSFSSVQMETEAVDCCERDVIIGYAVEA